MEVRCRGLERWSLDELKEWLKQFDVNGGGRISKGVLREAIRRRGGWFASLGAGRAVRHADKNKSSYEIENLITFAQKDLGIKVSAY